MTGLRVVASPRKLRFGRREMPGRSSAFPEEGIAAGDSTPSQNDTPGKGQVRMRIDDTTPLRTRDGVTLTSRRLVAGDIAALKRFYDDLTPRSRAFFLAHGLDRATLRKVTDRSEAGDDLVLGLFEDTRMVGYFFLWYFNNPVPLLGIGLSDAFHGRGLGKQMLQLLISEAAEHGCEGVELTTQMDNDRAFALYKAVGFEHYGDVENLQGDGTVERERAMFYRIAPDATPGDPPHAPPV